MARPVHHLGGDSLSAVQDHLQHLGAQGGLFMVSASRQAGAQIQGPLPQALTGIRGGKGEDLA
jgi:hypothetical protein